MLSTVADVFRFAAELECGRRRYLGTMVDQESPRDADAIIRFFKARMGGNIRFHISEIDFLDTTGLDAASDFCRRRPTVNALRSFILNFDETQGICRILLNRPMMNNCWRRFCKVKETSQAVIRRYSLQRGSPSDRLSGDPEMGKEYMVPDISIVDAAYVDTADVGAAARLLSLDAEREVPLSEFDLPDLETELRIEKSGEILAALLLFPPPDMVSARNRLLDGLGSVDGSLNRLEYVDFFPVADIWKVPTKLVQSFLTYDGLEYCCGAYEKAMADAGC